MIPETLLLAASADAAIAAETLAAPDTETGGLLVGCRIMFEGAPVCVVLHATGPGPAADKSAHTYARDTPALQDQLDALVAEARSKGLTVNYLGEWHKHPGDFAVLSEGDKAQGRSILADPTYFLPQGEVILPIVTVAAGVVTIHPYVVTPAPAQPTLLTLSVWADDILVALVREQED